MKRLLLSAVLLTGITANSTGTVIRDSLDFDRMNSVSPAEMIRGKVSGVYISSTDGGTNERLNTVIRSIGTPRNGSEPLWVVDGVCLSASIDRNLDAFWQSSYGEASYTSAKNVLDFINPYDIESIEVLKDASALATYGSRGANGVIIVKTKTAGSERPRVKWASNLGINTDASGLGLKPAVIHNHTVSFDNIERGNSYRVSAFFRNRNGIVPRDKSNTGGLNVNFDAKANKVVWFGLKSIITIGDNNSQNGTAWYGQESATELLRKTGSAQGFIEDHDDNSSNFRTANTAYLKINFLPNLHWNTQLGIDYQYDTRYVWYGKKTLFGGAKNGAAAILSSALLEARAGTTLDYEVYLAKNHLSATAGAEFYTSSDKTNTMNGTNFFNHELRAKGLRFNSDKAVLHKFENTINHFGLTGLLKYDYDGIAGTDLTLRTDKVSRYDDRMSVYPAANLWFDAHRLFSEAEAVSSMKFSGGIGKSGADSFSPYELFSLYCPGLAIPGFIEGTESLYEGMSRTRMSEWHVSTEMGFISDRITLCLTWFDKKVSDSFSWYCFGYDSGKNNRWKSGNRTNLGSTESIFNGKGLELDLGGKIIDGKRVKWTIDLNLTWMADRSEQLSDLSAGGSYFGGGITTDFNWNRQPGLFGGISTRLTAGNWAFDVNAYGAAGNEVLNLNRMFDDARTSASKEYVEKADYLRIGKIAASYSIPLNVKWLRELRISAQCQNPVTFTNYSGFRPDVNSFAKSSFTRGADYSSFPMSRTFLLGINLTF